MRSHNNFIYLLILVKVSAIKMSTCAMEEYPTLYEYYTTPNISSGLSADQPNFTLNGKNITIYSGAFHYFRVHPDYWRTRLRTMRAAGLNAVETYIPWNLHESERDKYDFGNGGTEFQQFLDVAKFLKTAQEEDLLAIVRPGPYICAEWEFGGIPSWVLRENDIKVRTSDTKFVEFVTNYFNKLIPILAELQFINGGPIIALQIENEYGNTKELFQPIDTNYLEIIRNLLISNGINSVLFTSDTPALGFSGTLPGVLATANFQNLPVLELSLLKLHQPDRPLMVMEYWSGWFDYWSGEHQTRPVEQFGQSLEEILNFNSSVNFYMFIGSTNWGFLNGGNYPDLWTTDNSNYLPIVTSYDYDAPVTESGNTTAKYFKLKEIIEQHNEVKTKIPEIPQISPPISYDTVKITHYLTLDDLIEQVEIVENDNLIAMELLPVNNNNGQSYGYVVYETTVTLPAKSILTIEGHVCDTVVVLVNGTAKTATPQNVEDIDNFGFWRKANSSLQFDNEDELPNAKLQLMVENFGRVNFGHLAQLVQFKGLWQGNVTINGNILTNWTIAPLEFKQNWTNSLNSLSNWKEFNGTSPASPALYKGVLTIEGDIQDTYVDLRNWVKGITIVNDFVLSRHFKFGPQLAAYLPAPLLQQGDNTILIFDHYQGGESINFSKEPINPV